MARKYSDDQFVEAVQKSSNIRQTLTALGLNATGANYKSFKKKLHSLNVDNTHWGDIKFRQGWSKGKTFPQKWRPLEEYLIDGDIPIGSCRLKNKLFSANIFEKKCYKCNNTQWNGLPIPLELDHINGINNDNRLENLTILCPNCHAQTATHAGKNIKKIPTPIVKPLALNPSIKYEEILANGQLQCRFYKEIHSFPRNNTRKIQRPTHQELLEDFETMTYIDMGKKYGVSEGSVRHWRKCYERT